MGARSERVLGLSLGTVLDAVFADPRRGHPVAGFGAVASRLEDRFSADTPARGVLLTSLGMAFGVGTGSALQRVTRMPTGSVVTTALATWTVPGGASLAAEATAMAPAVGGRARHALRVMRRDGASHPSPNEGRCETAFGVRPGSTNVYQGRVEGRGRLGDGVRPGADHVVRAVRLSRLVVAAALGLSRVVVHVLHVVHDARLP